MDPDTREVIENFSTGNTGAGTAADSTDTADNNPCHGQPDIPFTLESWTDDEATEWPALHSRDSTTYGTLPTWADEYLAEPGTDPSEFAEGSLSHYYHLASGGRFSLTGYVYPKVYFPQKTPLEYKNGDHEGNENGGSLLSREIIEYIDANPEGIVFDERFDRYTNGTNETVDSHGENARDGRFDMIIMVFRFNGLANILPINHGSAHASLGSLNYTCGNDGFTDNRPDSLMLGTLRVIDNYPCGSGVWGHGHKRRASFRTSAHEIGHWQFGIPHTSPSPTTTVESMSIMAGTGEPAMMSATDRIQLGWLNVDTLDVSGIPASGVPYTLKESVTTGQALYVKDGPGAPGDLLFEVRLHDNFWDRPPDGIAADGDNDDLFITHEGLYAFRRITPIGSGRAYGWASMGNHGFENRDRGRFLWDYHHAFTPGEAYTPFSLFHIPLYDGEGQNLDRKFAITDITATATGATMRLWGDFLEADTVKSVPNRYTLDEDASLARTSEWSLGGTFSFEEGITFSDTSGVTPSLTLLSNADLVLPKGTNSTLEGTPSELLPLVAHDRARINVLGNLTTEHVDMQPPDPNSDPYTWHGLHLYPDSQTELVRSKVRGVALEPLCEFDCNAAITLHQGLNAFAPEQSTLTLRGTIVELNQTAGIQLSDPDATVLVTNDGTAASRLHANGGPGLAVLGGEARISGDSEVELNTTAGVYSSGNEAVVNLDYANIRQNPVGVLSRNGANVFFHTKGPANEYAYVHDNDVAQVRAEDGGFITGGIADGGRCTYCDNWIENDLGDTAYDAVSVTGSVAHLEGNYWGSDVQTSADLVLNVDFGSVLTVDPILTSPPSLSGGKQASSPSTASLEGSEIAQSVSDILRTFEGGEHAEAFENLLEVLENVESEEEYRLAYSAAVYLFSREQPASALGWIENEADENETSRPWALRTLSVAHRAADDVATAREDAETLVEEYPTGEHARAGFLLGIRAALADEDVEGAEALHDALLAQFPESTDATDAARLLRMAREPEGTDPEKTDETLLAEASQTTGESERVLNLGEPAPNPTTDHTALVLTLPAEATLDVAVFDMLGRRVTHLPDAPYEAGDHLITLDTASLPAGIYVVRVLVSGETSERQTLSRTLTVAR